MMRFLVAVLLTIGFFLTIVGCVNTDSGQQGGGGTGKFLLKMDLSEIFSQTQESPTNKEYVLKSSVPEYYFLYVHITQGDLSPIQYKKIESENFEIILDKGGTYLFAIAKKDEHGIRTVGVITSRNTASCIFPISINADEVIDLGSIRMGTDELYTEIEANKLFEMTGYTEELFKSLKGYDVTLKHFLNPDINRDGIFDREQNLTWSTQLIFMYIFSDKNYYDENVELNISQLQSPDSYFWEDFLRIIFSIRWPELINNNSSNKNDWDCEVENPDGLKISKADRTEIYSGKELHFRFIVKRDWLKTGTYKFTIKHKSGRTYQMVLDNIHYLITPDTTVFAYPISTVKAYSSGKVKSVGWKWIKWQDGTYVNIPAEAAKIFLLDAANFGFYFFERVWELEPENSDKMGLIFRPGLEGIYPWENRQEISVENAISDGFWTYRGNYWTDGDEIMLKLYYMDVASNFYSVFVPIYFESPFPHDFEPNANNENGSASYTLKFPIKLLNGYYGRENWLNNGSNEPFKFGRIVLYEDGKFEAYDYYSWFLHNLSRPKIALKGYWQYEGEGKVKFITDDQKTYYMIFKYHNTYIECSISENSYPEKIDRSLRNYRIYTVLEAP